MTDADRQLDRLLSEDGARWRTAQPAAPDPDPALLSQPRRPRWQPLAAAAAVIVVAAGGVVAVAVSRRVADSPAAGGRTVGQTASPADAIVRDGDRVAGQGTVLARPGQPVRMCLSEPTVAIYPPPIPVCATGVEVTGLDLDRLSDRNERDGAVWGTARVEGVYRARRLAVSRQEAYRQPPQDKDASIPDTVPCREPVGGWTRPGDIRGAAVDLQQLVRHHPAELNGPYIAYPYGWHLQDQSNRKGTEVYVLGTTGDLAAARARALRVFPAEHLCVTRVSWSLGAMDAAQHDLQTPRARAAGIGMPFADVLNDRVTTELLVLDEAASRFLAGVADGRVVPQPMLAKVR